MPDFETVEREYRWLVRAITDRFYAPGLARDDLIQEGTIGLWKACRDFNGDGSFKSFAVICIERHVITAVKTATRGKHGPLNTAMDLDGPAGHDASDDAWLRDILAAPDCAAHEVAERREDFRSLAARLAVLSPRERRVLLHLANGGTYDSLPGMTAKQVDNTIQRARRKLAAVNAPADDRDEGILLVDRVVHPTERDAIRAARRVRPGCEIVALHKRKVRQGRVVSPQGRPAADGSLGRPVWAVEIQAA